MTAVGNSQLPPTGHVEQKNFIWFIYKNKSIILWKSWQLNIVLHERILFTSICFTLFLMFIFFVFSFLSVDTPHVVIKICKAAPPLFLLLIHTPHMATVFSHHNCRSRYCCKFCQSFLLALSGHSVACSFSFFFFVICWDILQHPCRCHMLYRWMCVRMYKVRAVLLLLLQVTRDLLS